jgi:transcription elongation factor B subunit 1
VSSDGFEFVVLRSCATVAGAINRMLDPSSTSLQISVTRIVLTISPDNFAESRTNRCVFENIKYDPASSHCKVFELTLVSHSGVVLEKVCEYFYYNEKNKDQKDVPDMEIPPELCLELLMAADYLNT